MTLFKKPQETFEKPLVEKYRPVTLDDVKDAYAALLRKKPSPLYEALKRLDPGADRGLADKVRASLGCDAPSVRALFDENPQAIDDFLQGAPTGNFLTQRFYRSAHRDGPVARPFDPLGTRETHPTTVH